MIVYDFIQQYQTYVLVFIALFYFVSHDYLLLPDELLLELLLDPELLLELELPHDEPELLRELDELPHEDELLGLLDELVVLLFLFPKPLVVGFCLADDVVLNDFCELVGAAIDLALAVTLLDALLALGLDILRVVVVVLGVLRVIRVVLVVVDILVL